MAARESGLCAVTRAKAKHVIFVGACRPTLPKLNVFLIRSSVAPGPIFTLKEGCSHSYVTAAGPDTKRSVHSLQS